MKKWVCGLGLLLVLAVSPVKASGYGNIMVFSSDALELYAPPSNAVAILNGGERVVPFGTNIVVVMNWVPVGIHTVQVTAAEGFVPGDCPYEQGAVNNPDSDWGNPQRIALAYDGDWNGGACDFAPLTQTTGTVRDAWTGERIPGAKVAFTARSKRIAGEVYDGAPNYATWKTNWYTTSDGGFPSNTYLCNVVWDLALTHTNYDTLVMSNILPEVCPGTFTSCGTVYLTPKDTNHNGIADTWEFAMFGSGILSDADPDEDGMNNWEEYVAGTLPTNVNSLFLMDNQSLGGTSGVVLRWPVSLGRSYCLEATDQLNTTDAWWRVNAVWEALEGQTYMTYTDTTADCETYFYNAKVVPWDYAGTTQRILHPITHWNGGSGDPCEDCPPGP